MISNHRHCLLSDGKLFLKHLSVSMFFCCFDECCCRLLYAIISVDDTRSLVNAMCSPLRARLPELVPGIKLAHSG